MDLILFETPLGPMGLAAEDDKLIRLYLPGEGVPRIACRETPLLIKAREELLSFLRWGRKDFDLPLDPEGTDFQKEVWAACARIPYGTTCSYGELAEQLGRSASSAAAVGQALKANPLPILIPCHRVIGKNGSLTGYSGGLENKKFLLALEGSLPESI